MGLDWTRILSNVAHAALLFGSAYAAYNPKWAWAVPAFTALGQMAPPPNFTARGGS